MSQIQTLEIPQISLLWSPNHVTSIHGPFGPLTNASMLLLDFGLLALIVLYTYAAPYTKVEESFNIQAIHDILHFGISRTALSQVRGFAVSRLVS